MLEEAHKDPTLLEQLGDDIGEMVRRLPHELRVDVEDQVLRAATSSDYASLIDQVQRYLVARITAEPQ
jgi:hypothetical protein